MSPTIPTLAIGDDFETQELLKQACREYALYHTFEYITLKANKTRYTIRCKSEGCPWRLHASQLDSTRMFRIKTYRTEHNCIGMLHGGHAQVTTSFLANKLSEKIKEQPFYRPIDMVKDIQSDLGVKISYSKAYRVKERGQELVNGKHEESFKALRQYCLDIERTNPGSKATLETTPDNKFLRMFVCYGASATGFAHCRPILGLDGTHLKTKYLGILLTATAIDANGQLFPLAYATVDAENDTNWLWFLQLLYGVIITYTQHFTVPGNLVFLSDRQKGLLEGVSLIFPDCPHGYCLRHLEENFHREFKNTQLKSLLWKAARAMTKDKFDLIIREMNGINPRAGPWLLSHANPEHWAELFFVGRRYGNFTSNIAESLNSWLLVAREMPILAMFEKIRQQLMTWFVERREIDKNNTGILVKSVANTIQVLQNDRSRRYRCIPCTAVWYEVSSSETLKDYIVKLDSQTCSCRAWQSKGYPCSHALAIVLLRKEDPALYAKEFFTMDAFRKTYAAPIIHPHNDDFNRPLRYTEPVEIINNSDDNPDSHESDSDIILPPNTRRPPGRPKKRRIRHRNELEGEIGVRRQNQKCSRCKEAGHSKRTCREVI